MQQPTATSYPISDFLDWRADGRLTVAPKFQRRGVWGDKARSYLIDTILRALPIPPLLIRLAIDPETHRTTREVVDGQQRLRAVLDYVDNRFAVLRVHNEQFGGRYFRDLDDDTQYRFLRYRFLLNVLDDVEDRDVLSIFARINTHTVVLNAQERRNAEFFGAFSQLVSRLALEHYEFWIANGILSDRAIARMAETELVAELVIAMLAGVRRTGGADVTEFYRRYDDELPEADTLAERFRSTMRTIEELLGGELASSAFRRRPLFYSLFCFVFDARFGLPGSDRARLAPGGADRQRIGSALRALGRALQNGEPPGGYEELLTAAGTANQPAARRARHELIWRAIAGPGQVG